MLEQAIESIAMKYVLPVVISEVEKYLPQLLDKLKEELMAEIKQLEQKVLSK